MNTCMSVTVMMTNNQGKHWNANHLGTVLSLCTGSAYDFLQCLHTCITTRETTVRYCRGLL